MGSERKSPCALGLTNPGLLFDTGAQLLFLPSYSPDLNLIEVAYSKIKSIVRKVGAHTREALEEAIAAAISTVTPEGAADWFAHADYEPQDQPM